jgi:TrkA domain protein
MLSHLAGLRQQAAGLLTEQISLPAGSPFVGRKLGDTRAAPAPARPSSRCCVTAT